MPETVVRLWVNYACKQVWIVQLRNPRQQNLNWLFQGHPANHWERQALSPGERCFLHSLHLPLPTADNSSSMGWNQLQGMDLTQHHLVPCRGRHFPAMVSLLMCPAPDTSMSSPIPELLCWWAAFYLDSLKSHILDPLILAVEQTCHPILPLLTIWFLVLKIGRFISQTHSVIRG